MYNIRMNSERGLRLTSLNIEGQQHLNLVLPFLRKQESDVICLQEVLEADIHEIQEVTGTNVVEYVPLVQFQGPNTARMPEVSRWGILYLVKRSLEVVNPKVDFYKKDSLQLPIYTPQDPNCVDRAILAATIIKNGKQYRVITTHFTWSPNGQPIPEQESNMQTLLSLLKKEDEFVFCGDTNAPRGGKIWNMIESNYHDNIPKNVQTTIDRTMHKSSSVGDYVVDCLFSTQQYKVRRVEVANGVSDHMAISGVIYRSS